MADDQRTKRFRCSHRCEGREFEIIVEPSYDGEPLEPDQIDWLDDITHCPVCGEETLEEI